MALPACAPLLVSVRASTPSRSEELPLGCRYHPTTSCSVLVVSHHLDRFLRTAAVGLLRPTANFEVRRVSRSAQPSSPEGSLARVPRFPRRGSYPSKGFPHQQPYRITAALALLSLVANLLAPTTCCLLRRGFSALSAPKSRPSVRTERLPKRALQPHASEESCGHARSPAEAGAHPPSIHRSAPSEAKVRCSKYDDAPIRRSEPPHRHTVVSRDQSVRSRRSRSSTTQQAG
jgi:hypothetical protein